MGRTWKFFALIACLSPWAKSLNHCSLVGGEDSDSISQSDTFALWAEHRGGGEEGAVTWASPSVERPPLSELGWDDQDPSLYFKCFYF